MKLSEHFDVREFVPKQVYDIFGDKSGQFVSDNVVKMMEGIYTFFDRYYKEKDSNVERIGVMINNWHVCGSFNWRGLRTVDYINEQLAKGIKTAKLSQHIGGSTNASDFNIILYFKGGKSLTINSNEIYDIILKNERYFMVTGMTTLENKTMTQGWTHADCRYTGLKNIYIVNP